MAKKDKQEKPERRARGEGTVFERADGRFVARIPLEGGKRKEEYYDTKQEAERAKRRMLNERDAGKLTVERDQTFTEYLMYWLAAHRVEIRETTYSTYHDCLTARVIPALGDVRLRKLTVEMFQSLYQKWLSEPLSPNTIRLIHTIVNEALNDAVKWKKLVFNPVQDVKLPPAQEPQNVYVLNEEEVDRLLESAKRMKLYPLFRMALLLGMRRGELMGLKWSDIDFEQASLKVQRSVSEKTNPDTGKTEYIVGPPKTKKGVRTIHLPQDVIAMLRSHREKQALQQAEAPHWAGLDLVFCTRYGRYIYPGTLRKTFNRLLKEAGLAHMKFHGLRHNASLILRWLGIDPIVRKEMMGHSSLDMTDGVYGHSTPKMHREAAEEIDRAFGDENEEGTED